MASGPIPADSEDLPLSAWAQRWRPAGTSREETIAADPSTALAGLFDQSSPVRGDGDPLPPLWHWLHFLDRPAESELGPDGHLRDGGFLPPVPRRHRMFAGGRIDIDAPIRAGERVRRESRVAKVEAKTGRSGELLFVTEEHVFTVDGRTRMTEQQDIVYRRAPLPGSAPRAAGTPARDGTEEPGAAAGEAPDPWRLRLLPTPAMLFRFSALTFNAHRIHYDHPYTTRVEGFPGLVVHGPLLALGLLELPRRLGRTVRHYSFRLRRPCFVDRPVLLTGTPAAEGADLSAFGAGEEPAVTARAEFAAP
ncbi:3-methylfumaryl-CoA hydratase [Spinactinospora alkalitolerans]|uniref:3-methylfumaryl-CoA hydratase n=1 Tax=Spinactinospora alkalitolerans TaxID=687207 RepID=A0A852TY12_9ACTN|nr:MaoC family dehydratase N-terminal domain-containing protein [Spinactinospora alkalitolerans]NYE48225.1 3-methylfumaryl-CoA hydratase [Spinactinospora alkalitolerans]